MELVPPHQESATTESDPESIRATPITDPQSDNSEITFSKEENASLENSTPLNFSDRLRSILDRGIVALSIALVLAYPALLGITNFWFARIDLSFMLLFAWLYFCPSSVNNKQVITWVVSFPIVVFVGIYVDRQVEFYQDRLALPVFFKSPERFTASEQNEIRHSLIKVREYLKSIEFPIHDHLPSIGMAPTLHGPGLGTMPPGFTSWSIGAAPYSQGILLGGHKITTNYVVGSYVSWESYSAFFIDGQAPSPPQEILAFSVASYLNSSYVDNHSDPTGADVWYPAFWKMRNVTGKEFTDRWIASIARIFHDRGHPIDQVITNGAEDYHASYTVLRDAFWSVDDGSNQKYFDDIVTNSSLLPKP